jgi:hypothetical protein
MEPVPERLQCSVSGLPPKAAIRRLNFMIPGAWPPAVHTDQQPTKSILC